MDWRHPQLLVAGRFPGGTGALAAHNDWRHTMNWLRWRHFFRDWRHRCAPSVARLPLFFRGFPAGARRFRPAEFGQCSRADIGKA